MNLKSFKIVRLNIFSLIGAYRRQIIVFIALIAPFVVLDIIANMGGNHFPGIVQHHSRNNNTDFPFLTLDYIRKTTTNLLANSEKMSQEDYVKLRENNPSFPTTVEEYRIVTKKRLDKLNAMTTEDWQQEVNEKIPPLQWYSSGSAQPDNNASKDTTPAGKFTPFIANDATPAKPAAADKKQKHQ